MASSSSRVLRCAPRRSCFSVSAANTRSTRLRQRRGAVSPRSGAPPAQSAGRPPGAGHPAAAHPASRPVAAPKTPAPFAHRLMGHAAPLGDRAVGLATRALQHNPRAGPGLGRGAPSAPALLAQIRLSSKVRVGLLARSGVLPPYEKTPAELQFHSIYL